MADTALLLIDLQNDYFPGGKMELVGSEQAGQAAARLLACFREKGLPVVHIQHLSVRPGATFFLPGTPGAEIHAGVRPLPGEAVIQKNFPNSFRGTNLLEHLQGLGTLEFRLRIAADHNVLDPGNHKTSAGVGLRFGIPRA